jgi:hypothetical protein
VAPLAKALRALTAPSSFFGNRSDALYCSSQIALRQACGFSVLRNRSADLAVAKGGHSPTGTCFSDSDYDRPLGAVGTPPQNEHRVTQFVA